MIDYETMKRILGPKFYNPAETQPRYAEDFDTEYLLTDGTVLFVFDKYGKYLWYKTSW